MSGIGATAAEAVAEMETAIETYRAKGWPLPVPRRLPAASGTCLVRLPRTLHARLVLLAAQGVSLNALVTTLLAEAVGVASSERRVV
jgi:predicted HicB family RNase H-like nuclease